MAGSKAGVDRTHQNAARQAGRGLKGDASGKSNKLPLENENAIQTPCSRSGRQVQFTITEKKVGMFSHIVVISPFSKKHCAYRSVLERCAVRFTNTPLYLFFRGGH